MQPRLPVVVVTLAALRSQIVDCIKDEQGRHEASLVIEHLRRFSHLRRADSTFSHYEYLISSGLIL